MNSYNPDGCTKLMIALIDNALRPPAEVNEERFNRRIRIGNLRRRGRELERFSRHPGVMHAADVLQIDYDSMRKSIERIAALYLSKAQELEDTVCDKTDFVGTAESQRPLSLPSFTTYENEVSPQRENLIQRTSYLSAVPITSLLRQATLF